MTKKLNRRAAAKLRTYDKAIKAARSAFSSVDYHTVTMRNLAQIMGMSTGAIFANFASKADLFERAMGFKPPLDGPLSRAAPMLAGASVAARTALGLMGDVDSEVVRAAVKKIDAAIELASSPLDGEAWARHLDTIQRAEPHLAAGQADPSLSPDGSAA